MSTSVPPIQWTPSGPIVPSDSAILAGVQADINSAFGGGVNPALETPQGQIASSESAVIADKDSEILYITNQVDPQYATDRFQDAIGRIYFLTRKPATPTSVTAILVGLSGTVVPVGTLAQDTNGNTYVLQGTVTIGVGGTVSSTWANQKTGPIPCLAGSLTQVYQAVAGWDAISNPGDGVIGQDVESRSEFEYRRQNSVSKNANGTNGAIYGNVFEVDNVLDCYVVDNPTGSTVNKGSTNYPLLPHSVYVAVVGGADAAIATAIWQKKDVGCDYNGNTDVTVTDQSGYSFPYPSYDIKFERPAALPIFFNVQIVNDPTLPSDIVTKVKTAIIARFTGTDQTVRERIGSTVFAARYYSAISAIASNVIPISILIGTSGPGSLPSYLVGIDQTPTISPSDITVTLV